MNQAKARIANLQREVRTRPLPKMEANVTSLDEAIKLKKASELLKQDEGIEKATAAANEDAIRIEAEAEAQRIKAIAEAEKAKIMTEQLKEEQRRQDEERKQRQQKQEAQSKLLREKASRPDIQAQLVHFTTPGIWNPTRSSARSKDRFSVEPKPMSLNQGDGSIAIGSHRVAVDGTDREQSLQRPPTAWPSILETSVVRQS